MAASPTPAERACAVFVPRTILGLVYLFAGIHKLADPGALEYGRGMALLPDAVRFVPGAVVMMVGALTPFLEIVLGALVLVGFWTRPALRVLAVLVVLVAMAYGVHALYHPMGATAMNITIVNTFILPRAALVAITLYLPAADDLWSVDGLLDGRTRRWLAGSS
ncbi:MAG: MauE/DoxX family redox-associated membrane protein [Vicinamibacterales bacterium]